MLKSRMKRIVEQGGRNDKRFAAIEAAIIALNNDDLLDLADIFEAKASNPIKEIVESEMAKRGISL